VGRWFAVCDKRFRCSWSGASFRAVGGDFVAVHSPSRRVKPVQDRRANSLARLEPNIRLSRLKKGVKAGDASTTSFSRQPSESMVTKRNYFDTRRTASLELISTFPPFARSGRRVRKRDRDVFRSPTLPIMQDQVTRLGTTWQSAGSLLRWNLTGRAY
jgi:hypothetical protein